MDEKIKWKKLKKKDVLLKENQQKRENWGNGGKRSGKKFKILKKGEIKIWERKKETGSKSS